MKYCKNCNRSLDDDSIFCCFCGTRVGKESYVPKDDLMQVIYGPMPVTKEYNCKQCGYSWEEVIVFHDCEFCVQCGAKLEEKKLPIYIPKEKVYKKICPDCKGTTAPEGKFCASCGKEINVPEAEDSTEEYNIDETMTFCTFCNGTIRFGDKYCVTCGKLSSFWRQ